ncbi:DUF4372 domain-containing protein [Pedobacter cryoconitis]|uniref:DUF4372 domain-containing protein n=1 Tax=Pedobacter cryoconitis TaxID=188932 RepID=UPI001620E10C
MRKVNLFSQISAHISREKFDKLVLKHQSDKHAKGLKLDSTGEYALLSDKWSRVTVN